ncbi:MAG: phenylalanine--tRNA ligase subunit beta [Thermoanaerobaculales bacterium]
MIFDSEWLTEHLEGAPDLDILADRLTDCGCLVELRELGDGAEKWDVEVTTNRPDAMNHRGLAREAAVATGAALRPLEFDLEESGERASSLATIEIDDPELCSRYVARVIRGIRVTSSPGWMQRRLLNCGVRPINVVVDVTNYVLLELGQPLHAFDLDRLRGGRIVVRRAQPGEFLTTLDGVDRKLDPSMLMVADGAGIVAVAGIVGGADSEIHEDTNDVLLESAHFDALSVRRAARRLGVHTEASHRFERGCDPEMAAVACDRAAAMIAELAGGQVCRDRIDVYPRPWKARGMAISIEALSSFTGLAIAAERVVDIFAGLGFAPQCRGDEVQITVPPYRVDIDRLPDLYEEIIRHVGYDAVPAELPVLPTAPGRRNANWELVDRARSAAVSAGLVEIITWSFIDPETDVLVATQPQCPGAQLPLDNPLAQTQSVMRRSLMPGMLMAAAANFNQGELDLAIFEQGRVFSLGDGGARESERVGVVLSVGTASDAQAFSRLKGIVDALSHRVGLCPVDWRPGGGRWLDNNAGAELAAEDGTVVGFAGMLSPEMLARWELRRKVAVAELDLGLAEEPPSPRFEALPRYPAVVADMTVEHSAELSFAELEAAVRELAAEQVTDLSLAARYTGEGLGVGMVRTTLRLVYRQPDRSLTQEEVNSEQDRLREKLVQRLGITFA